MRCTSHIFDVRLINDDRQRTYRIESREIACMSLFALLLKVRRMEILFFFIYISNDLKWPVVGSKWVHCQGGHPIKLSINDGWHDGFDRFERHNSTYLLINAFSVIPFPFEYRFVAFYALAWLMIQLRIHVSVFSSHNEPSHCATQHSPHSWCLALSIWLAKSFVTSKWIYRRIRRSIITT